MPFEGNALRFGDVVLVPFPFTDQSAAKRRPAVVISAAAYHLRHPDVILMPITSQLRDEARPDDLVVRDWRDAGLLKPSAIKPVVTTLERSLLIRTLGTLSDRDRSALEETLPVLLGSG